MATAVGVGGISVVYPYVRDMERSLRSYRDLLGTPLEGGDDWVETLQDVRGAVVEVVDSDGHIVNLFQRAR